jgi:hypothetical protein
MKRSTSLTELLCQVKDKRRKQGTRHSLSDILLITILAHMSGYIGYRSIEDFCKRYESDLHQLLGYPKHGIASYSSIRRVIMDLDFNVVATLFYKWIRGRVHIKRGEWVQIDGKSMAGTIEEYSSKYQNFVALVSLFMNRTGVVLSAMTMNNKEQSEINIVRQLLDQLKLKNVVISMDAIHCQKKHLTKL